MVERSAHGRPQSLSTSTAALPSGFIQTVFIDVAVTKPLPHSSRKQTNVAQQSRRSPKVLVRMVLDAKLRSPEIRKSIMKPHSVFWSRTSPKALQLVCGRFTNRDSFCVLAGLRHDGGTLLETKGRGRADEQLVYRYEALCIFGVMKTLTSCSQDGCM